MYLLNIYLEIFSLNNAFLKIYYICFLFSNITGRFFSNTKTIRENTAFKEKGKIIHLFICLFV